MELKTKVIYSTDGLKPYRGFYSRTEILKHKAQLNAKYGVLKADKTNEKEKKTWD